MAPSKLAPTAKEEMVRLYRQTDASFSHLSKQFGISVSTVSRLLQEAIPSDEYKEIVSHKQNLRPKRSKQVVHSLTHSEIIPTETEQPSELEDTQLEAIEPETVISEKPVISEPAQLDLLQLHSAPVETPLVQDDTEALVEEIIDDLEEIDPEFESDNELEDELENELEEELLEEDDLESEEEFDGEEIIVPASTLVNILPFSQAVFPDPCYMVVDKAHEIVTRPLKAFKDLGIIPEEESQSVTVPIFHNHRVVRRFCNAHQLIVKFSPHLLHATKSKLEQKGITRLLLDGRVYALS